MSQELLLIVTGASAGYALPYLMKNFGWKGKLGVIVGYIIGNIIGGASSIAYFKNVYDKLFEANFCAMLLGTVIGYYRSRYKE